MSDQVLITGGMGYIGSHTVVELISSGYRPVIVDDLSNSDIKILDGIERITGLRPAFEQFSLTNRNALEKMFGKYPDIKSIIHFAASKAVGESVEKPLLYYRNNLLSLINLLECMKDFDAPHLVFSSSCTVYGQPEQLPVTESAPVQKPESPYGNTKKISEEIIEDTVRAVQSIRAISLRYFNPIGAHESAAIGELPLGVPNNLVPFITQTAAGLRERLRVFGDDYNTPDGSAIRDYIHVVDLARAHIVALKRLIEGRNRSPYEFFNLGTGRGHSVLEAIRSFEKVTGVSVNYEIVGRRPGDIEKIWADTKLANEELGWKAGKTLDEMMLSAWNWQQQLGK